MFGRAWPLTPGEKDAVGRERSLTPSLAVVKQQPDLESHFTPTPDVYSSYKHTILHMNAAKSLHTLFPLLFSSKVGPLANLSSSEFLLEHRFIRSSLGLSR